MRRLPLRSPPRMRGKVIVRSRNAVQIGITPAYAGKSARILKRRTEKRDHPRVCGEKLKFGTNVTKNPGSPPRVRGKGAVKIKAQPQAGITPACAGKSTKQEKHRDKAKDHPRVCGEKPCRCRYPVQPSGSPPRVRGKVQRRPAGIRPPGITPACAGKRGCDHQRQNRARDHPRVCGEKRRIVVHSAQSVGSPPRVRGKD